MLQVSRLAASIKPSATLAAAARAKQLQAAGVRIRDFSLGEPDFPTPEHVCEAARQAMKAGKTRYTQASGTPELRAAVAQLYVGTYGLAVTPEQVLISNGAKHSLHNALAGSINPGDEVIIPTPYWVSYSDLVAMTGGIPVLVPTTMESGFRLTPEALKAAVTPRTKMLLLNAPSNPTGAVYSRSQLEAIAKVVLETGISVLSDEIYELFHYDSAPRSISAYYPEGTIVAGGFSKTLGVTGWRVGWACGPAAIVGEMIKLQQFTFVCAPQPVQWAGLAALTCDVSDRVAEYARNREFLLNELGGTYDIRGSGGAFYLFIKAPWGTATEFVSKAIENELLIIPGNVFSQHDSHFRVSFAADESTLHRGVEILKRIAARA